MDSGYTYMSGHPPPTGYRPLREKTVAKRAMLIGALFIAFAYLAVQVPTGGPISIGFAFHAMASASWRIGVPIAFIGFVAYIRD